MSADEISLVRDWFATAFTVAFWIWFAMLAYTAFQLAVNAIRHRGAS